MNADLLFDNDRVVRGQLHLMDVLCVCWSLLDLIFSLLLTLMATLFAIVLINLLCLVLLIVYWLVLIHRLLLVALHWSDEPVVWTENLDLLNDLKRKTHLLHFAVHC